MPFGLIPTCSVRITSFVDVSIKLTGSLDQLETKPVRVQPGEGWPY